MGDAKRREDHNRVINTFIQLGFATHIESELAHLVQRLYISSRIHGCVGIIIADDICLGDEDKIGRDMVDALLLPYKVIELDSLSSKPGREPEPEPGQEPDLDSLDPKFRKRNKKNWKTKRYF